MKCLAIAAALFSISAGSLCAQAIAPKEIGVFTDWVVYKDDTATPGKAPACWAAAEPVASKFSRDGKSVETVERDDARLFATYQPEVEGKAVFSYLAGFQMDHTEKAVVTAKATDFTLAVGNNIAWVLAEDDASAFAEMKKAREAVVTTVSRHGTDVTDTFSMMGVSAAIRAMIEACEAEAPTEATADVTADLVASEAPQFSAGE